MNKKKTMIVSLMAIMLLMSVPVALAETDVTVDWTGFGGVDVTFNSGDDAVATVGASGYTTGSFYGIDYDVNHYGYGVDSGLFTMESTIDNGGSLRFQVDRTDSKTSYSPDGQRTYTFVGTDGTGYLDWSSQTNYASMSNNQYGFASTSFGVSDAIHDSVIDHIVTSGYGDFGSVSWLGVGDASIWLMGESAGSGFNMGKLPTLGHGEAWDNNFATFDADGAGIFSLTGVASDSISVHEGGWTIPGDGNLGSAVYDLDITYSGAWSYLDFGISGN